MQQYSQENLGHQIDVRVVATVVTIGAFFGLAGRRLVRRVGWFLLVTTVVGGVAGVVLSGLLSSKPGVSGARLPLCPNGVASSRYIASTGAEMAVCANGGEYALSISANGGSLGEFQALNGTIPVTRTALGWEGTVDSPEGLISLLVTAEEVEIERHGSDPLVTSAAVTRR